MNRSVIPYAKDFSYGHSRRPLATQPSLIARRMLAWVIDVGIIVVPMALVSATVQVETASSSNDDNFGAGFPFAIGAVVLLIAYHTVLEARGQTLGKRLLGLVVQRRSTGSAPGLIRALARSVARAVFWIATVGLLGAIDAAWGLVDRDGRTLHDHIAGTQVVLAAPSSQADRHL